MKKILLLLTFFSINLLFAQKADLTSAILAFQKNDLTAAKKWIDIANTKILEGQTLKPKVTSKFYYYRGQIYLKHFQAAISDSLLELDFNFLDTASESFTLDVNLQSTFSKKSIIELNICATLYAQNGIQDYKKGNYVLAGNKFVKSLDIYKHSAISRVDTSIIYNAALAFYNAEDYNQSVTFYKQLIFLNNEEPNYYIQLIDNYNQMADLEKELETIEDARALFPTNKEIITKEANYYLSIGDNNLLLAKLETSINADPNNIYLRFILASTYTNLGDFEKSILSYKQLLTVDSSYVAADNNIAAIYLDKAIILDEKRNALAINISEKTYNNLSNQIKEQYLLALPHLEKVYIDQPTNQVVIFNLQTIYYQLDMSKKMIEMKNVLTKLKNITLSE